MSQSEDRSFYGLILSLIFHGALFFYVWKMPPPSLHLSAPISIEIVEKQKGRPVPSFQVPTKQLTDRLRDQTKLLSQRTQRVLDEQLAPLRDTNINSNNNAPFDPIAATKRGLRANAGDTKPGPPGNEGDSAREMSMGPSSTTVIIPGIKQGNFTFLNTDQLTFFAFYSRMSEQVVSRWAREVRAYLEAASENEIAYLTKENRVVRLEIILNPKGEFVRSVVHSESGSINLDQAPVEAFRRAAPFINPPQEMVKADGFIHLFGQFTLITRN